MDRNFRVLVCGGRHFNNYSVLESVLDSVLEVRDIEYANAEIVSGHCDGADKLGELFAKNHDIPVKIFEPNWQAFGRAAGPIRNRQMIDYISEFPKESIVVAFISKNSKGTYNTIQLARTHNIPVITVPYSQEETFTELFEGIYKNDNGKFVIDWNDNHPSDVVKFDSTCAHLTKFNKQLRCFGYRINKTADKIDRSDFIRFIKENANTSYVRELIEKLLADFYEKSFIKNFDYILKLPSRSPLNSLICDCIVDKFDDAVVIDCYKLPITELTFDWERFTKSFKGDYIDQFKKYMENYIAELKKDSTFSISKISPKYRRYFRPMIKFGDTAIDKDSDILIVDDVFTTGSTLNVVFDQLQEIGFNGNIVTLTLINNN